jgi:hypothetical protein
MMPAWAAALSVTLIIEVPLVAALFPGQRVRMALVAVVMNVATNLMLNLVFARLRGAARDYLLPGEILVVLLEAAAYAICSRQIARSLCVSSLANALSFAAGFTSLPMLLLR